MPKRPRLDDAKKLSDVFHIRGLLVLVYSFLLDPLLESIYSAHDNQRIWIQLRQFCRMGMLWSTQLLALLSPEVGSPEKLQAWTRMAPGLQHVQADRSTWVPSPISLTQLRSICLNRNSISPEDINSWDCTRLEYLELLNCRTTQLALDAVSSRFPRLTHLDCNMVDPNCTISNFPNLTKFVFTARGCKRLFITNMAALTTLEFSYGNLDLLQFTNVPHLQHVYSEGCPGVKEVEFCDSVPILETFHLAYNPDLTTVDRYEYVNWPSVKKLAFVYSDSWEKIWGQLKAVEVLSIYRFPPGIQWPKLASLHRLSLSECDPAILQDMIGLRNNLTSLSLHWHGELDVRDISYFCNVSSLVLEESGEVRHLESLTSMASLRSLQIGMRVPEKEYYVLKAWQTSDTTRSLTCRYRR